MEKCSIVVPCYNEEEALPLFYEETEKVLATMPMLEFEYMFVDDGSWDGTLEVMRALAAKDPKVHYVSLPQREE